MPHPCLKSFPALQGFGTGNKPAFLLLFTLSFHLWSDPEPTGPANKRVHKSSGNTALPAGWDTANLGRAHAPWLQDFRGFVFRREIAFCHQEWRFEEWHPKGCFFSWPPLLVPLPQIIPQAEFICLPCCWPSMFDIALRLLHKQGQVRFLTSHSNQTNYTVMRGRIPTRWFGTRCQRWPPRGPEEQMSAHSQKANVEIKSIHRAGKKSTHAIPAFIVCIICPCTQYWIGPKEKYFC